jgi:hypothetical protein
MQQSAFADMQLAFKDGQSVIVVIARHRSADVTVQLAFLKKKIL